MAPQVVPPLRLRFEPPRAGATPAEVVRGFLTAGSDLDDDAAAPRAFLTGRALREWQPRARVVVHAGTLPPEITRISPSTMRLSAQAVAVIDADGRYAQQPAGTVISATIGMARQVDGEWRIATLPPDFGLWLSSSYSELTFSPFRLHYLSTASRTLVPDVRWLPLVGGGVATTVARAQLEQIPPYLQGAVTTGFPAGTGLSVDAVAIEDGIAVVDLSRQMADASPQDQRGAWAQLLASLDQAPGVTGVALRVDGAPLQLPDVRSAVQSLADLGYGGPAPVASQRLLTRVGGRLAVVARDVLRGGPDQQGRAESQTDLVFPTVGARWTDLAAPADLAEVAAVDVGRTVLQRWSTRGGPLARHGQLGHTLTPPAYDRHGFMWVAGLDARGEQVLWAVPSGTSDASQPGRVDLPILQRQTIVALRVAADGQRVAMILRSTQGACALAIVGVTRDPRGVPQRVSAPVRVGSALVDATDVAWLDDITLGVLGRAASDGAPRPYVIPLARHSDPLPQVAGARAVVATGEGRGGLLVLTTTGRLLGEASDRWRELGRFDDLVVPGT